MAQLRKLHLFNCDRTYKLDAVEGLLVAVKAKLGFDFDVQKHYFSLAQMPEMTHNTIPKLEMDMAFFVVHAHESRLSINEDNAGIGYAKIYRALLEATGGKVIVIIGGDDNYKNKDEEDRVVISRWARRKIISQFSDEFLDGRKSFIFSWNKEPRAIHKEALLHYFDPIKKGQKFEYQPEPKERERGKSTQTSMSVRAPLQKCQSMKDQRVEGIGGGSSSSAEQRREEFSVGRSRSAEETTEYSSNIAEQSIDDYSQFGSTTGTGRTTGAMSTSDSGHGAKSKEHPSASTGRTQVTSKELAILGCNASEESMQAVKEVFKDIGFKLNLAANPPFKNFAPLQVKQYLEENSLKFCVLVVDAETVNDGYDKLPKRKGEYEELLWTAADKVGERVIILVCDNASLESKEDETIARQTIDRIINKQGKGFIACLTKGKLSVDIDVLVQLLTSLSPQQLNLSSDYQKTISDATGSAAKSLSAQSGQSQSDPPKKDQSELVLGLESNGPNTQQPTSQAAKIVPQYHPPALSITWEHVLLRSLLFNGRISYQLEDLQLWDPTFTVPDQINQILFQLYHETPVTGVTIVQRIDGKLGWSVDPQLIKVSKSRYKGINIADNETLMLKTRVRYGQVSFQESDVQFRYGTWQIPQNIVENLKEEYCSTPSGDLYITSDNREQLRMVVKVGTISKARCFFNKLEHGLKM